MSQTSAGTLYLISVPIGNPEDITQRAARLLGEVDAVICEEYKEGSKLLKSLDIQKPLLQLNEHNPQSKLGEIIPLLKEGKSLALIPDCGTPVFADPGTLLLQSALEMGTRVIPVPGASSLMAALVCTPLDITEFHYAGFLPRKSHIRLKKLNKLKALNVTTVIYEAPYRLMVLLEDVMSVYGENHWASLSISLTEPTEQVHFKTIKQLFHHFKANPIKAPFVLILAPIKPQR